MSVTMKKDGTPYCQPKVHPYTEFGFPLQIISRYALNMLILKARPDIKATVT